jgi:hypothetical protein|uniref:Uncharacterized protein n=1 Tax=viral metagenome TaxID=1070528 RepID=A0A6C0CHL1_9ZZZZ
MFIVPINNLKINISELETYLFNNYEKLLFNTNEGKFEIHGDKIYKIKDTEPTNIYTLENSKYSFHIKENDNKKEIFHIPINYKYEKMEVKQYQLHKNSILTLIIENKTNFYFFTKENQITNSVKEDLISFLSILKLYN